MRPPTFSRSFPALALPLLVGACAPAASAPGSATLRSAEAKNALPLLPDDGDRPFSPRAGVVVLGANGVLVAIRLWEGDASAASVCVSGLDASTGGRAALSLMPNVDGPLPQASGYPLDDRTTALFDGRLQHRRVAKVRAKLPAKIASGSTTRMHFDIRDESGVSAYAGDVEVLFCGAE